MHTHTHRHKYTCTNRHTQTHTHTHTYTHKHKQKAHTHKPSCMQARTHSHTHLHTHTRAVPHTHTYTSARMQTPPAPTHTHTHKHTRDQHWLQHGYVVWTSHDFLDSPPVFRSTLKVLNRTARCFVSSLQKKRLGLTEGRRKDKRKGRRSNKKSGRRERKKNRGRRERNNNRAERRCVGFCNVHKRPATFTATSQHAPGFGTGVSVWIASGFGSHCHVASEDRLETPLTPPTPDCRVLPTMTECTLICTEP